MVVLVVSQCVCLSLSVPSSWIRHQSPTSGVWSLAVGLYHCTFQHWNRNRKVSDSDMLLISHWHSTRSVWLISQEAFKFTRFMRCLAPLNHFHLNPSLTATSNRILQWNVIIPDKKRVSSLALPPQTPVPEDLKVERGVHHPIHCYLPRTGNVYFLLILESAEAMGMVDMGLGQEVWEKEQERENWKVADWTEEDEQMMSGATYEWISMYADFEWIVAIAFDRPDFIWVSQLQRDRDVVAQLEVCSAYLCLFKHLHFMLCQAVDALSKMPIAIVSSTFTKTVLVPNHYFRIRCETALALINVSHLLYYPWYHPNSFVSVLCNVWTFWACSIYSNFFLWAWGSSTRSFQSYLCTEAKWLLRPFRALCTQGEFI